jgi:hypothetical protein
VKISHAYLVVVAAGMLSFGVVIPAAATSTHKATVRVSAKADARTVLIGAPVVVTGRVSPAAVGPVVLEKLVNQDWVVFARAKSTVDGGYAFSVGSARRGGAWLLRVVRPAAAKTKEGDSATLRVDVVRTAYKVSVSLEWPSMYDGDPARLNGTVTPVPDGSVQLQQLDATGWHTFTTVPVGSNGGFAGSITLPVGHWSLRAVQAPSATIAGGQSVPVIASVYPALPAS